MIINDSSGFYLVIRFAHDMAYAVDYSILGAFQIRFHSHAQFAVVFGTQHGVTCFDWLLYCKKSLHNMDYEFIGVVYAELIIIWKVNRLLSKDRTTSFLYKSTPIYLHTLCPWQNLSCCEIQHFAMTINHNIIKYEKIVVRLGIRTVVQAAISV